MKAYKWFKNLSIRKRQKMSDEAIQTDNVSSNEQDTNALPSSAVAWTRAPMHVVEGIEDLVQSGLQSTYDQFQNVISNIAIGIEKINMDLETDILTLEQLQEAYSYVKSSADVVRTPVLMHVQNLFTKIDLNNTEDLAKAKCNNDAKDNSSDEELDAEEDGRQKVMDLSKVDLYMKMENMQTTGSFKIRGVVNQMHQMIKKHGEGSRFITMSAGNYGKAFAYCVGRSSAKSMCIMPKTAPHSRVTIIQKMGVEVKQVPTSELQAEVDLLVKEKGYVFCHSFDDADLIAGHASSGLELLEDVSDPDVVVVSCGGGGFVSGIAAAISLSGHKNCRIYAVEPVGAPTMYESFKARRAISYPNVKTIATGLAPPYAGHLCYKHCRWFLQDILLVTDEEILEAMKQMFHRGIKAEPSGSAALAAVLSGKVPDIEGKKVVVYVSGGNVSCEELNQYIVES